MQGMACFVTEKLLGIIYYFVSEKSSEHVETSHHQSPFLINFKYLHGK